MTIIAVRSSKGGVGRTSVTALLAAALARRGVEVAVMDLDRQDALRLMCGEAAGRPAALEASRLELAATRSGFARVAQDAATCALLMGGGPHAARFAPNVLARWLGAQEVLIVDMPAVEDAAAAAVSALAGLHLRLFLPDVASLAVLQEPSQDEAFSRSVFLLNQADRRRPLTDGALGFLRHVAGARFGGEIRRDEAVPEAFASLLPLHEHAPASAAWEDVQALAAQLEVRLAAAARFETAHFASAEGARRA